VGVVPPRPDRSCWYAQGARRLYIDSSRTRRDGDDRAVASISRDARPSFEGSLDKRSLEDSVRRHGYLTFLHEVPVPAGFDDQSACVRNHCSSAGASSNPRAGCVVFPDGSKPGHRDPGVDRKPRQE